MTPTRQSPAEDVPACSLARRVAGRLDTQVEPALREHGRQLRKLGDGLTVLLSAQQRPPAGQPDWLRTRQPEAAKAMLTGVVRWVEDIGHTLDVQPTACWPWHPAAVAALLAASEQYRAAYSGDVSRAVVDLHVTQLPALERRASAAVGGLCNASVHRVGEAAFLYDVRRLDDLAIWWATSREGLPPGLRPRD